MDLQVEILFFFYFFSYISYPIFWRRRATSPGVVRCSYTTPDGTRSLAGFYTNFLVAFCTTNVEDFRNLFIAEEVIEVDQLEEKNNGGH